MVILKYLIGALYAFVIVFLMIFITSLLYGAVMETIKWMNK